MAEQLKSCGFLVTRTAPELSFLLMKHADRWDLPKGHVDAGESEWTCALRELEEETGLREVDLVFDSRFRFELHYDVRDRSDPARWVPKTLVVFLACLKRDIPIRPTEHLDCQWFPWHPPHAIQMQTIDPLLAELERHAVLSPTLCDGQRPVSHR